MSILTYGLAEHGVRDYHDYVAVLDRLAPTVPDLLRVRDYWRSVSPQFMDSHPDWTVIHHKNPPDEYLAYRGPGGFSVQFGQRVAVIGAACRYSGFVTIGPLQAIHLPAFRSIARALGGARLVLMPEENGPIEDAAMLDGASLDECITLLRRNWSEPHPRIEVVTDEDLVWYLDELPSN
jgi:hypothetical protein